MGKYYYCSRRPRSYPMRCAVAAGSWSPHTGGCDRVYRLRWDTAVAADRRAYSLVGAGSSFGGFHCKLWATDRTVFVVIVLNFFIIHFRAILVVARDGSRSCDLEDLYDY